MNKQVGGTEIPQANRGEAGKITNEATRPPVLTKETAANALANSKDRDMVGIIEPAVRLFDNKKPPEDSDKVLQLVARKGEAQQLGENKSVQPPATKIEADTATSGEQHQKPSDEGEAKPTQDGETKGKGAGAAGAAGEQSHQQNSPKQDAVKQKVETYKAKTARGEKLTRTELDDLADIRRGTSGEENRALNTDIGNIFLENATVIDIAKQLNETMDKLPPAQREAMQRDIDQLLRKMEQYKNLTKEQLATVLSPEELALLNLFGGVEITVGKH